MEDFDEKHRNNKDKACWVGYHQVGWKKKNGKKVPNCVPNKSKSENLRLHESLIDKLSRLQKHFNEK